MPISALTEKEMLQAQGRQIFTIEKLLKNDMISLKDLEELLPGLFHINSPVDSSLLYISQLGCDFLKMDREEVMAETGIEQLMQLISPDTLRHVLPRFLNFYSEEDDLKVLGAFQQIRRRGEEDFTWVYTTTKIYQKLNAPISISIPVDDMGELGDKIESMLEDNVFMRKNYMKFASLTKREHEILKMVAMGTRRSDIADALCIAVTTYDTHRKHIREKLGLKSAACWVRYARAFGLVC